MAPSCDCAAAAAASIHLLCAEDTNTFLGFFDDDDDDDVDQLEQGWIWGKKRRGFHGNFNLNLLMDFPLQSEECIAHDLQRELDHMPMENYAQRLLKGAMDASFRSHAIDWMWKVHAYFNFGPLSAYLSVNYLDRFLSVYNIPENNAWMMQLLSVACLSLASKMEEVMVPLLLDLQQVGDAKFVFEARTVQRMELLVLSTLKFRLQAVTPFSFLDYFLHKFSDGNGTMKFLVLQSTDLLLAMIKGIDFLEFKPSELAAAAALTVLEEESESVEIEKTISDCAYLNLKKERVLTCYEIIQSKIRKHLSPNANKTSDASVPLTPPESPVAVLEMQCLSRTTTTTTTTTGDDDDDDDSNFTLYLSESNGCSRSPTSKRRRITNP